MTALITRVGSEVDSIDMFSGFGGSSQGMKRSGANIKLAANHNEFALQVHAANNPDTEHLRADLVDTDSADYVDPITLPPVRFLWASPSCKHHSRANAQKLYAQGPAAVGLAEDEFDQVKFAASERSRVTMLCPLRYAAKHQPEIVAIENVVEVAQWGPEKPGSTTGDGSTFRWWLNEWVKLGYEYECLFLNAMFFPPCPQSRDRIYIVFWRKGNQKPDLDYRPKAYCVSDRCQGRLVDAVQTWKKRTAAWPLEKWGKYNAQYFYACPNCKERVEPAAMPAYSAIDWSNLGPRIGERSKVGLGPLKDTTMERIRRGLTKFRNGPAVVIPAKAVWGTDRPVLGSLPTQTGQQEHGLAVQSFITKHYGSKAEAKYRSKGMGEALGAITGNDSHSLSTITLPTNGNVAERPGQTRARNIADQLFTQHTGLSYGFASMPFIAELRGGGSNERAVTEHLSTFSAEGFHHGLTSPALFQKINGSPGDTRWHSMSDPLNTLTSRDTTGVLVLPWIDQWMSDPVRVTEQLATVMTHLRHSLAMVEAADLTDITDDELMQVRFRMLAPNPEIRRGMAFAEDFILFGTQSRQAEGLGNAVVPPVAAFVTERALATLDAAGADRSWAA